MNRENLPSRRLDKVSLRTQLKAGFGVLIICSIVSGGIGWWQLNRTNESYSKILEREVATREYALELQEEALQHRRFEKDFFLNSGNRSKQEDYLKRFDKSGQHTLRLLDDLEAVSATYEARQNAIDSQIDSARKHYLAYRDGFFKLSKEMLAASEPLHPSEANARMKPVKEDIYTFEEAVGSVLKISAESLQNRKAAIRTSAQAGARLLALFALGASLTAILVGFLVMRAYGAGVARVVSSISARLTSLRDISSGLQARSREVADGATEGAASLQEAAASLTEVSSIVRENAGHATSAQENLQSADRHFKDVTQVLVRLKDSVSETSRLSEESRKIVTSIDEISFQTNILALNAAVEAARAGEAGAGFAVVADEVRNLAGRAAKAAQESSALLEKIAQRIAADDTELQRTTAGVEDMRNDSRQTVEKMERVVRTTGELEQALNQISVSVGQLDTRTQQNAANATEMDRESAVVAQRTQLIQRELEALGHPKAQAASNLPAAPSNSRNGGAQSSARRAPNPRPNAVGASGFHVRADGPAFRSQGQNGQFRR